MGEEGKRKEKGGGESEARKSFRTGVAMSTKGIFTEFIEKFDCQVIQKVSESKLNDVENELDITFPDNYRKLLLTQGVLNCDKVLDYLVDDYPYILYYFVPIKEIVDDNRGNWKAGMPLDYYLFAFDPTGDAFCFSKEIDDRAVYYFNHETVKIKKISNNLTDLINEYLNIVNKRGL